MSKKFSLSNKVAIITGGGSGIGKAIAITFAKQGANVNILDSNFDAANSTVNEILKINCIANAFQCDVSNLEEKVTFRVSLTRKGNTYLGNSTVKVEIGENKVEEEIVLPRIDDYNDDITAGIKIIGLTSSKIKEIVTGIIAIRT